MRQLLSGSGQRLGKELCKAVELDLLAAYTVIDIRGLRWYCGACLVACPLKKTHIHISPVQY